MAEPPAKIHRHDFADTIVVCVGEGDDKEDFVVHRSFAIKSSKFLQAALNHNHNWKEAREKRITLPEAESHDFKTYLEWVYTGQLTIEGLATAFDDQQKSASFMAMIRLYILGDYLGDVMFCNTITDTIIPNSRQLAFSGNHINLAWDKTTAGSTLRKVLLDFLVRRFTKCFAGPFGQDLSKEVLLDICIHLNNRPSLSEGIHETTRSLKFFEGKCAYHTHDDEHPRCSKDSNLGESDIEEADFF